MPFNSTKTNFLGLNFSKFMLFLHTYSRLEKQFSFHRKNQQSQIQELAGCRYSFMFCSDVRRDKDSIVGCDEFSSSGVSIISLAFSGEHRCMGTRDRYASYSPSAADIVLLSLSSSSNHNQSYIYVSHQ